MSDEYYKQVYGEVCELTEDSEGRAKYKWIKKYPDVEALYCLVYILGLHTILNMRKWSDGKWNTCDIVEKTSKEKNLHSSPSHEEKAYFL